jgi:hypothetical protein
MRNKFVLALWPAIKGPHSGVKPNNPREGATGFKSLVVCSNLSIRNTLRIQKAAGQFEGSVKIPA